MHTFILHDSADGLLEPDLRKRVSRAKRKIDDMYGFGHLYSDDVRAAVKSLVQSGHFAKERVPKGFTQKMNEMFTAPESFAWTMKERDGTDALEPMAQDDILLVGGIIAAEILQPDEFWADHAGFSSPTDLHTLVGVLALRNRDLFFDHGGGTWSSEYDDVAYRNAVTGSQHGDLRIFRSCESFLPTKDPFGNDAHCRPVGDADRQMVSAYHSTEPTLLTGILKYVDQQKVDVPCLRDGGKQLLSDLAGKGQYAGNFADFGTEGIGGPEFGFFNFAFPMKDDPNAERSLFFDLPTEGHGAYRMHLDARGHLAFTRVSKHGKVSEKPSLTLPPEEMDQFVRALLTQTQQGKGRTSMRQLRQVLEYRYREGFEADMEKTRKEILG
jgi:hypothetical protein